MTKRIENIIHLIIVITTFVAVGLYFIGIKDSMGGTGPKCLKYFTTDSNILAMIASALCLIFAKSRPRWVEVFRFVATVAVSITFFTVIFFLVPSAMASGASLGKAMYFFKGNIFVLHLSTPVLSIIALMLPAAKDILQVKEVLLAIIPVFIYSMVYLVMVVFVKAWNDWYGFTLGGHYALAPVAIIVMYAFTFGLAMLEWKIEKVIFEKNNK